MNDRQHYVFLQDGDVIQEGDEFTDGRDWKRSPRKGEPYSYENNRIHRRPVSTAQPTETCKWKRGIRNFARTPHEPSSLYVVEDWTYCPTCSKRIEVVE